MSQFSKTLERRPFFQKLKSLFPTRKITQALEFSGRQFRDRILPAKTCILVFMCAFLQNKKSIPRTLEFLNDDSPDLPISDQALYQMRQRIGWRPFWWLRRYVLRFFADLTQDPRAFYRGLRLLGIDGTIFTVADSPANVRTFGKSRNQHKSSGFPLARMVALCELGTRTIGHYVTRAYHYAERKMALKLLRFVPKNSLLIADRGFHGYDMWYQAQYYGFFQLLRVQSGPKFPVLEAYPDGSYRSVVYPSKGKQKKKRGISVRVIDVWLRIQGRTVFYRLVTNLIDPAFAPALELVELYAKRWEIEIAFAEIKSQLKGRTTHIRSQSPEAALAELDALMMGYYAVRYIALETARKAGVDPLTISFTQIICTLESMAPRIDLKWNHFYRRAKRRMNKRRKRAYTRCRKVVRCAWPVKKPKDLQIRYEDAEFEIKVPPKIVP